MTAAAALVAGDWLVVSARQPPIPDGAVRIVDGAVAAVGPAPELRAAHGQDEIVDAAGHVIMPGFVNSHCHMYGVLAHGMPVREPPSGFASFLEDFWWPEVEDALDVDMIAAAADWACAEMLASGTTTFYDILEAPSTVPGVLTAELDIVRERGIRGVLSFEATERVSAENGRLGLAENLDLIAATGDDGLVSGMVCYHTTFTCSTELIAAAHELAAEHGVLCHAHCNEGTYEGEWCQEHYGRRTLELYADLGLATPGFLASQCVQLSEREQDIIAESGIRVAHMPLANCEVGGGIAPVPELAARGVTVGLGSDGYVNDMFEVMRGAFLVHKARRLDPATMPAEQVLAMATEGGAAALGQPDIGRLEPGCSADLQVVDARFPTPTTAANLVDQLVLYRNAGHVRDVMVAGAWRVRNGEVLGFDRQRARARLHEQARRLWAT